MVICSLEETKEMWCPFARVQFRDCSVNRADTGGPLNASRCIGDKCMAWTWRPLGQDASGIMLRMEMERLGIDPKIPRGYCGLAHRGPA